MRNIHKIIIRARKLMGRMFVEKQVFFRANQGVRFINLSTRMQACIAVAGVFLVAWLAAGSLSLLLHGRLIEERISENLELREQLRTTITAYENRLSSIEDLSSSQLDELNNSYEDLHGRFENLRNRFFDTVDALETRQHRLHSALDRYQVLESPLDNEAARQSASLLSPPSQKSNRLIASKQTFSRPLMHSRITPVSGRFQDNALFDNFPEFQGIIQKQFPETLRTVQKNVNTTGQWVTEMSGAIDSAITELDIEQSYLMSAVEEWIEEDILELERVISMAGFPLQFAPEITASTPLAKTPTESFGAGGPLLLEETDAGGRSIYGYSPSVEHQLARIKNNLNRLENLQDLVRSLPLSLPFEDNEFALSSGYGMRVDPFTRRPAFHGGLDFIAPHKSPVITTAAGVVTRVGWKGPYGRTVDVDHGNGVVTRYGHLAEFLVEKGDILKARQRIGLIGSSGRSTGTHLHYEVRVNGKAQNPWNFLKAGHYVVSKNAKRK